MIGVPKHCEGFVAIWLRAREEFVDNRFQLLFIYTSRDSPPTASFHCNGAPLMTSHDGIAMMALPQ